MHAKSVEVGLRCRTELVGVWLGCAPTQVGGVPHGLQGPGTLWWAGDWGMVCCVLGPFTQQRAAGPGTVLDAWNMSDKTQPLPCLLLAGTRAGRWSLSGNRP